jgi:hypothetical protein
MMARALLAALCITQAAAPFEHHDPDSIYPVRLRLSLFLFLVLLHLCRPAMRPALSSSRRLLTQPRRRRRLMQPRRSSSFTQRRALQPGSRRKTST